MKVIIIILRNRENSNKRKCLVKKKINKLSQISKDMFDELREVDQPDFPESGHENLIGVVAVSAIGEVRLVEIINSENVIDYYLEEGREYIENDFGESPGIYLVEFRIEGSCDYWGEYDSWAEFDNVVKYKLDIADKTTSSKFDVPYSRGFQYKTYDKNNKGSEKPYCLLYVCDDGYIMILDVLNEDKARKIDILSLNGLFEDVTYNDKLKNLFQTNGVYKATAIIEGDEIRLEDRDKFKLLLEEKPTCEGQHLTKKQKTIEDLKKFCEYIDELRRKDEHI